MGVPEARSRWGGGLQPGGHQPAGSEQSPFGGGSSGVSQLTAALLRLWMRREGVPLEMASGSPVVPQPPPPPATHLRVLVEENFVPGHRHEQLVLKPSQLQEAALVGRVGGTAGGRGHQCPLQSFALPLLRDLLQGPYPLVTVRCGAGGETGQDQPGARSLRGSSLGSGEGEGEQLGPPRSRDPPQPLSLTVTLGPKHEVAVVGDDLEFLVPDAGDAGDGGDWDEPLGVGILGQGRGGETHCSPPRPQGGGMGTTPGSRC